MSRRKYIGDFIECIIEDTADIGLIEACEELDEWLKKLEEMASDHYEMIYGREPKGTVLVLDPLKDLSSPFFMAKVKGDTLKIYAKIDEPPIAVLDLKSRSLIGTPIGVKEGREYGHKIIKRILEKTFEDIYGYECERVGNKYVCSDIPQRFLKDKENIKKLVKTMSVFLFKFPDKERIKDEYGSIRNMSGHIIYWMKEIR